MAEKAEYTRNPLIGFRDLTELNVYINSLQVNMKETRRRHGGNMKERGRRKALLLISLTFWSQKNAVWKMGGLES